MTLIGLSLLSFILFMWSAYDSRFIINPDGISYMSIARQYAEGHFDTAVNALLPPVLSWLMAPLILLGLSGQNAFMAISFLTASAVLVVGMFLVWRQTKRSLGATLLFWALGTPFLIHAIGFTIAPDLLVALWVILLLITAIKVEEWLKRATVKNELVAGGLLGALGAFGYLTKQFVLPFFVGALLVWFLVRAVVYRKSLLRDFNLRKVFYFFRIPLISLGVMVIVLLPWVAALSDKYDRLMLGSRIGSVVSANLEGAETSATTENNLKVPLRVPPSQYAVAYGECHGCPVPGEPKKDEGQRRAPDYGHYLSKRVEAFPKYLNRISAMGIFIIPVAILLGLAFAFRKLSYRKNTSLALAGIFWFVYFGGYAVLFGTSSFTSLSRYLWPLFILSALITCISLPIIWKSLKKRSNFTKMFFIALVFMLPVSSLIQYWSMLTDLTTPARKPLIQHVAEDLRNKGIISQGDKIASNNSRQTLYLAFHLGAQSYGSITRDGQDKPEFAESRVQNKLRSYNISYYVHYSSPDDVRLDLGDTGAKIVKIYPLKRLGCDNYRGAPGVPCNITVVKLP